MLTWKVDQNINPKDNEIDESYGAETSVIKNLELKRETLFNN